MIVILKTNVLFNRGLFDHFGKQREELENASSSHEGSLSHELIAGAASYEAIKAYNKHCEKEGYVFIYFTLSYSN